MATSWGYKWCLLNRGELNMEQIKPFKYKGKSRLYYWSPLYQARFSEIDQYNILWNGHYISYFEEARFSLLSHFNVSISDLDEANLILPVRGYNIELRKPIMAQDKFQVLVRPSFVFEGVIKFQHLLICNEKVHATSELSHVIVHKETGLYSLKPPKAFADGMVKLFNAFDIHIEKDRFSQVEKRI